MASLKIVSDLAGGREVHGVYNADFGPMRKLTNVLEDYSEIKQWWLLNYL